jgi:hypothetical protein
LQAAVCPRALCRRAPSYFWHGQGQRAKGPVPKQDAAEQCVSTHRGTSHMFCHACCVGGSSSAALSGLVRFGTGCGHAIGAILGSPSARTSTCPACRRATRALVAQLPLMWSRHTRLHLYMSACHISKRTFPWWSGRECCGQLCYWTAAAAAAHEKHTTLAGVPKPATPAWVVLIAVWGQPTACRVTNSSQEL